VGACQHGKAHRGELWGDAGRRQGAFLGPLEKAVKEAKTETARKHREDYLAHVTNVFNVSNSSILALPNHPIDPAKLPMKVDLGGITAVFESYPGHSGTDVIVRVPEQNVVYAGDLLFSSMYPVWLRRAGYCVRVEADVEDIRLLGQGHAVCAWTWTDLWAGRDALSQALFDDIEEQAQKMRKAGVPAVEAADLYEIPEKYKNIGIFAWGFSIGPAILKLYAEWEPSNRDGSARARRH